MATDAGGTVVLLFDDVELGAQLREALQERGARIVHEGGAAGFDQAMLQRLDADVLVINLDESAGDDVDRLYDLIDGDRPRVVFNDAQASRGLAGWDRARWARHLAVKVLAAGDLDPPRPDDAREIDEVPVVLAETMPDEAVVATGAATLVEAGADPVSGSDHNEYEEQVAAAESETLAAELEALLASGELSGEDEVVEGSGLRNFDDESLPPLHDGDFGTMAEAIVPALELDATEPATGAATDASAPVAPSWDMELAPISDAAAAVPSAAPIVAPSAPDSWALLDADAEPMVEVPEATDFGVEKLSAADFLAPDIEPVTPEFEPMMSLELVSMEEAIAPQSYVRDIDHELVMDELGGALSRVILLGAAVDAVDAVGGFLEALPGTTRLTFVLAQHAEGQPFEALVESLAARSPLPVRTASHGGRVGAGEICVVPPEQSLRLRRDGRTELVDAGDGGQLSIDATLSMAANAFGSDALAIVFAGKGNDGVAGAQAIHDRGGRVWVESPSGERSSDMVDGILAERLVSFSGTTAELAARLIEVFP